MKEAQTALYRSLAKHYAEDIHAGRLGVGARLPALRRVAKQHGVSLTTAVKAYETLEQDGWITAHAQSGFFVAERKACGETPLQPSFLGENANPANCAPADGYNPQCDFFSPLGIAMLAPSLLPNAALQRSIKRAARNAGHSLMEYPNPQGSEHLRHSVAQHFRKYDFIFNGHELVVTHGCLHAVRIAVESVSKKGDAIAISSPCFNGLLELLSDMSRNIVEIPCTDEGLDLCQLEQHIQQGNIAAGLFSTSHMNPSGTCLSPEQKMALADLAARYSTPIIEDDVYLELGFDKKPPLPAKHWDKAGEIIWCGSVSKTLAAGMRLGWCLPGRYLSTYIRRHKSTSYGVNTLMQASLADFINGGDYATHLNKLRPKLARQALHYQRFLREILPGSARISKPSGGIVLWLQVPGLNAQALACEAKHECIDIRSGNSFSTLNYYHDCFRVNYGWPLDDIPEASAANSDSAARTPQAKKELMRIAQLVHKQLIQNTRSSC